MKLISEMTPHEITQDADHWARLRAENRLDDIEAEYGGSVSCPPQLRFRYIQEERFRIDRIALRRRQNATARSRGFRNYAEMTEYVK